MFFSQGGEGYCGQKEKEVLRGNTTDIIHWKTANTDIGVPTFEERGEETSPQT